jgi:hypothetical protein
MVDAGSSEIRFMSLKSLLRGRFRSSISFFYKYYVPLALICSNQPKRQIGACSRGAKYL